MPATPQAQAFARALATVARTDRLLVALDFDGTLSPLVDNPGSARVLPKAAEAIAVLERLPQTWVAYVSGRPLDSLAELTAADDGALLIGSHGDEVRIDGTTIELVLGDDERERLSALEIMLSALIDSTPNAMLEHKPVGLGVHSRLVERAAVPALRDAALAAAQAVGGFVVREGKDILEFTVRNATKGDGIERLREHVAASAVLYAGDDVTDEDAFAVMREDDLGVKVGDGATAAQYRVADPQAIGVMLSLLAGARTNVLAESSNP
jgi:trehalose 6-phosphate phosphatase